MQRKQVVISCTMTFVTPCVSEEEFVIQNAVYQFFKTYFLVLMSGKNIFEKDREEINKRFFCLLLFFTITCAKIGLSGQHGAFPGNKKTAYVFPGV
ncbi:MAG: hypothetical protein H6559_22955 [Lewinellaceae bacterium]|nr:hypothetical protein [Lewinellaceae bacterium]